MIPGEICMVLLHQFTLNTDKKEVKYGENHTSIKYFDDWTGLEPIMKRNMERTEMCGSGVVVAGAAEFKWMLVPYSKLVVSLLFYSC